MKIQSTQDHFLYGKSCKMIHWGCSFDSMLELKFAISIQDDYEFLRSRVVIYYHHGTKQPTSYIREGIRRYTPDFLIRHRTTGEAFLIEIKPREAERDPQLVTRKKVAENYIKWKGYDWQFKTIFSDEIFLDETGWDLYHQCRKLKSKADFLYWLTVQEARYKISAPTYFGKAPSEKTVRFVMFGSIDKKQPNSSVPS
jgi:hypothetical protein